MAGLDRETATRYGAAVGLAGAAVGARLALDGALGLLFPYATLYLAVVAAAWHGGFRPALTAAVAGAALAAFFLIPPRNSFAVKDWDQQAGLALYLVTSAGIAVIGGRLFAAERRATALAAEAGASRDAMDALTWRRRRAEAELRDRDDRLKLFVENAADYAVILTDPAGVVTEWLGGAAPITGWSAAEMRGQPLDRIFTPEDAAAGAPAKETDTAARVGRAEDKRWHRRKDGSAFFAEGVTVPLRGDAGELRGFGKVFRDATARKRAEDTLRFLAGAGAALAELTDYESALQRVAGLAVPWFADWCTVDMVQPAGPPRRLAVNHVDPAKVQLAHEVYRKYPPHPADPRSVPLVLRTGEPDWAADIPDAVLAAAARDAEHLRIMRELGLKSFVCVPLKSRAGLIGALTFVTAESGRVYGPADVRTAEDLAARAVVALDNATLVAALKEADRRKDDFLATLAHELRNPLAPVRNSLEVMRLANGDPALTETARVTMARQVGQMVRLIDDLLDVSRIARDKLELRKELTDLGAVVAAAVETARPLIAEHGHRLTVAPPAAPVRLSADPTRLAQALTNLLNNAAKYTDPGGEITLTYGPAGGAAVVTVRDTGIGIAADRLAGVFEMFNQVDHTLERTRGGLGIGLSLVRRLVEMHGGTVTARSPGAGLGSEFEVRLPLGPEAGPRPADDRPAAAAVAPAKKRVLVVDDNVDAAESMAALLAVGGHEVRTAHDGEAAVAAAEAFRPALILLDIGLPKLNGYEACRRIRDLPAGRAAVIVALTGWGQDEDRRRSRAAGFDRHLVKPADYATLQEILAAAPGDTREAPGPPIS